MKRRRVGAPDVRSSLPEVARRPASEISFEARVKATGLRPQPDDLRELETAVADLDRAAALLRGPRSYAEEPICGFRLKPAGM